jgi:hypothetical protein
MLTKLFFYFQTLVKFDYYDNKMESARRIPEFINNGYANQRRLWQNLSSNVLGEETVTNAIKIPLKP